MAKAGHAAGDGTPCPRTKQRSGTKSSGRYPQHDPGTGIEQSTLALSMGLPGTRLDMALGGPHPLLVELVRHLARTAARADHAGTQPTLINADTIQENL